MPTLISTSETETAVRTAAQSVRVATEPCVDSAVLLGRQQSVAIRHRDETYRLRQTRQGKLILTK